MARVGSFKTLMLSTNSQGRCLHLLTYKGEAWCQQHFGYMCVVREGSGIGRSSLDSLCGGISRLVSLFPQMWHGLVVPRWYFGVGSILGMEAFPWLWACSLEGYSFCNSMDNIEGEE